MSHLYFIHLSTKGNLKYKILRALEVHKVDFFFYGKNMYFRHKTENAQYTTPVLKTRSGFESKYLILISAFTGPQLWQNNVNPGTVQLKNSFLFKVLTPEIECLTGMDSIRGL